MTAPSQIAELLADVGGKSTFSCKRNRASKDLDLEIEGVGKLRFPVSSRQAKALCRVARPARYGHKEKTLLDRNVRDTWEIPKELVSIDESRWQKTMLPALDAMAGELGIDPKLRFKADLHALLVYETGQFFRPHQDSEKSDDMVGTLVVTLPGSCRGGDLVVEHQGESHSYSANAKHLSLVAFYADCRHEVKPVEQGYRISLTYNLSLVESDHRTSGQSPRRPPPSGVVEDLTRQLRHHFESPLPARTSWNPDAPDKPPATRLIYLLDHQYTQRGLARNRLKGKDISRGDVLLAAAEAYGCEAVLALAEIHEIWHCTEPGWDEPYYRRRRSWHRGDDDEWHDEDPVDPDEYDLADLIDSEIQITHWVESSGEDPRPIESSVRSYEVCASTPTSELRAYSSEYEGYMGNYGNTMDRWYRRAAIVLWPIAKSFMVRAEASPGWALKTLLKTLRSGELDEARSQTSSILHFWPQAAKTEDGLLHLDTALEIATGLADDALAAALLQPYCLEALGPKHAELMVGLAKAYGIDWLWDLLAHWSDAAPRFSFALRNLDPRKFVSSMPRLGKRLVEAAPELGPVITELLLQDRWLWLQKEIRSTVQLNRPSELAKAVSKLTDPLLRTLECAAQIEATDLQTEILGFVVDEKMSLLIPALLALLRTADQESIVMSGLDELRESCTQHLTKCLEEPERPADDWSISPPEGCGCELCQTLGAFLADGSQELLEWPIAKPKRRHIHHKIDDHELPVSHSTIRSGSPYTLVLKKLPSLHLQEAKKRLFWQTELDRLTRAPA